MYNLYRFLQICTDLYKSVQIFTDLYKSLQIKIKIFSKTEEEKMISHSTIISKTSLWGSKPVTFLRSQAAQLPS